MAAISKYNARCGKIGKRIKEERKLAQLTQIELADKLTEMIYPNGDKIISQSTVASWEIGKTIPPLNRLVALSTIFKCDIGYLLCDYDERTKDSSNICKITGLAESSVHELTTLTMFGDNDVQNVIDILINDNVYTNIDQTGTAYRSVLNLLHFFFNYSPSTFCNQIDIHGNITSYNGSFMGKAGYIASDSIQINDRVIENAVMLEIQNALFSIKRNLGIQ